MAIAIDLGEWNDIHPDNKKDVGERLALAAEKIAYGEKDIVYSGPLYRSSAIDGSKITISFNHIGGGLVTNDEEELREFAIAGNDKKFVWAKATIEGNNVAVWSDAVTSPMYVRYAWATILMARIYIIKKVYQLRHSEPINDDLVQLRIASCRF